MKQLLIIEDDSSLREFFSEIFRQDGYKVFALSGFDICLFNIAPEVI